MPPARPRARRGASSCASWSRPWRSSGRSGWRASWWSATSLTGPGRAVLESLLYERKRDYVSYEDWQLIDALERERGGEVGAPRLKFSRVEEMLHALGERKEELRRAAPAGAGSPSREAPSG